MFCSYARGDAEAVRAIAIELDKLGQQVWIDQKLSGGQSWWNTILEQVRTCDCFLLALSEKSLRSKACRAELDYAYRLGRTILPVVVGPVIDALVPGYVAELHRVEAGDTHGLARALLSLSPTPPLPDPLPEPPPVPISYLDGLATQLDRDELTLNEQRILEADLKQRLENPEEREAAIVLLRRLRQHPSITEFVAREVEADLASVAPPPIPDPAPIPVPDPIPAPIPDPRPGPDHGPDPEDAGRPDRLRVPPAPGGGHGRRARVRARVRPRPPPRARAAAAPASSWRRPWWWCWPSPGWPSGPWCPLAATAATTGTARTSRPRSSSRAAPTAAAAAAPRPPAAAAPGPRPLTD